MDALRRSIEEEKEEAARAKREAEQARVPPTAPESASGPSVAKAAPAKPTPAVVVTDDKARRVTKAKADEARRRKLVKEILARQHKAAQQDVFE